MDYQIISVVAVTVAVGGGLAWLGNRIAAKEDAKLLRDRYRKDHPQIAEHWPDNGSFTAHYENAADRIMGNEPLKQTPPNIGGEGHLPYRGPNYFDAEDTANYLKPIPHFGNDPLSSDRFGDLAWEHEAGRVASDGGIWLSTPGVRVLTGTCTVLDIEVPKAARFGWTLVPNSTCNGYSEVERKRR